MTIKEYMGINGIDFQSDIYLCPDSANGEELMKIEFHSCDGDFTVDSESTRMDNISLDELKRLVSDIQSFINVCETKV